MKKSLPTFPSTVPLSQLCGTPRLSDAPVSNCTQSIAGYGGNRRLASVSTPSLHAETACDTAWRRHDRLIEEIASDPDASQHTVETLTTQLNIVRSLGRAEPPRNTADSVMRDILASITLEHHKDRALLNASTSLEQIKALTSDLANRTPAKDAISPTTNEDHP